MSVQAWLRSALVVAGLWVAGCTSTTAAPAHVEAPMAQARRRVPCASEGFSCKPGPCCHGLTCVDDVCRKPTRP